jgi:hypothetical protein
MEDAFDESCHRFTVLKWKLEIHFFFEIAENTQVKASKYVIHVGRETYDFHLMMREHL